MAWQSESARQGEQKSPAPLHVPARGWHADSDVHCWLIPVQSAALPHSGVHVPESQCWYVPLVGGQSSSLLHDVPCAGVHTDHCDWHLASRAQSAVLPHCGEQ